MEPQEAIRTSAALAIAPGCVHVPLDTTIWLGRSDLISAPEEIRVLMASVAEHAMDGSDPICEEIAGRGAPGHAPVTDPVAKGRKLLRQQAAIAGFGSFALREPDLTKIVTEA